MFFDFGFLEFCMFVSFSNVFPADVKCKKRHRMLM